MTSSFSFRKLFYGFLVLLFAGILWFTMQTCQKADNEFGQTSDNAKGTMAKIGDAASELKNETAEKAGEAARSAGNMIDKAAEKTGNAMEAASEMAGKAADKAGEAYQAAGEMAGKAADKVGESYQAGKDFAGGAAENAGDTRISASELAAKAADKTEETFRSGDSHDNQKGSAMAADAAGKRPFEVAASYTPQASGKAALPVLQSAEITAEGTWRFDDLQFGYNQSDLNPDAKASLMHLAAALKSRPELSIEIQGHTDSRGSRDYNLDLSLKRARSVKAFLESEGIAASRMKTAGFGPDRPLHGDAYGESFAGDRRVEIKPFF